MILYIAEETREDSTHSKVKVTSPTIFAFNSNSISRFNPTCNLTGFDSAGTAFFGDWPNEFLFFFLRLLRPDIFELVLDEKSELESFCGLLRSFRMEFLEGTVPFVDVNGAVGVAFLAFVFLVGDAIIRC